MWFTTNRLFTLKSNIILNFILWILFFENYFQLNFVNSHIINWKKQCLQGTESQILLGEQSVECRALVRCASPKRGSPNRPQSIVKAVLIYNTIKTHGKTVDAILVINWGTSYSQSRHHSRLYVFMCSYKLFVLIVVFCFAVNCFLFASQSEVLIGIFRNCWPESLMLIWCSVMAFCSVTVESLY